MKPLQCVEHSINLLNVDVLGNMEDILQFHKQVIKDNHLQGSLFDSITSAKFTLKKSPAVTQEEKLAWEKELLGLFVSGFPLDPWKEKIDARGITIDKIILGTFDNQKISIAAIIEQVKVTVTKKGDKMALVTLRDHYGSMEVAVFPESYKTLKDLLILDIPLIFKGKISIRNDARTMVVDEVEKLIKK